MKLQQDLQVFQGSILYKLSHEINNVPIQLVNRLRRDLLGLAIENQWNINRDPEYPRDFSDLTDCITSISYIHYTLTTSLRYIK